MENTKTFSVLVEDGLMTEVLIAATSKQKRKRKWELKIIIKLK